MKHIHSGKAWQRHMRFAPAVRVSAGPLVYTSGITGRGIDGKIVPGGMAAQAKQTFENIRDVLEAAASSMEDIVKLTYYVTDMSRWEEVASARSEFFSNNLPASTTVEVKRLWDPDCLVEIEAIAIAKKEGGTS